MKGTAQDKDHRERQDHPTQGNHTYIIVKGNVEVSECAEPIPEAIEGEFTEA